MFAMSRRGLFNVPSQHRPSGNTGSISAASDASLDSLGVNLSGIWGPGVHPTPETQSANAAALHYQPLSSFSSASAQASVINSKSAPPSDGEAEGLLNSAVPEMLNPQKIYKAFTDGQKLIYELQKKNKLLTAENADLNLQLAVLGRRNRPNGAKTAGKKKASPAQEESPGSILVNNTQKLGRHHQLFWCVIVEVAQFSQESRPTWKWDDYEIRYSTAENWKKGPMAELYFAIPSEYHDLMSLALRADSSGQFFVQEFHNSMSQSRSTSLNTLRGNTGIIFESYKIAPACFDNSNIAAKGKNPEILQLLGYDTNGETSGKAYAQFPPVLCKDDDTSPHKRFLNPVLFRVARCVIFGKSAISSVLATVGRSSSMYLRDDKAPETTIGLIAWVAIMTRYILSTDVVFDQSGVGKNTKISYYSDYDYYKHWLMRTSVEQPDYFRFLMATWNAKIFSHHKKSKGVVDGECETIMLADESEQIACDMEDFCFEAESGAMPVNINATDNGNNHADIYGSDSDSNDGIQHASESDGRPVITSTGTNDPPHMVEPGLTAAIHTHLNESEPANRPPQSLPVLPAAEPAPNPVNAPVRRSARARGTNRSAQIMSPVMESMQNPNLDPPAVRIQKRGRPKK